MTEPKWVYVDSTEALERSVEALERATGPVGIDVERASGFKYFGRAYLLQVFREGAGTFLFDPVHLETLAPLADVISDDEWVLHAANADLSSLAELGLRPNKIYDTELASRLLGFDRVGLGSMTENLLDTKLEKAYSRADWSTRPLPEPWLEYAALDVMLLPELRNATYELLRQQGKLRFAEEEFEALLSWQPKAESSEPWRKLSGFGKLRSPKQIAMAKELWIARDKFARQLDLAPGRILPNSALIAVALADPRSASELARLKDFTGKYSRTEIDRWWKAIRRAKVNAPVELKQASLTENESAPANVKSWERVKPEALKRLQESREVLRAEAERLNIPAENLLSPAVLKAISWDPPEKISDQTISHALRERGARSWQTELFSQALADIFVETI